MLSPVPVHSATESSRPTILLEGILRKIGCSEKLHLSQKIIRNMPFHIFDHTEFDNVSGFDQEIATLLTQVQQVEFLAILTVPLSDILK